MAPDADRMLQRVGRGMDEDSAIATEPTARTLASLQEKEVAIDGMIYDITNFDHPGGESIYIFGGNDVTVQYKMIHPYHTSKHLEKLRQVGTIANYQCEYVTCWSCCFLF